MSSNELAFKGRLPRIADGVFVAPTATVIGDVELDRDASVWFGCVLRGDVMPIRIGARSNIQDLTLAHGTSGRYAVQIGCEVTVGHRAVLHGCTVADHVLIGMGAILLDGVEVGEGAIVAAGAVVSPGTIVAPRTLVAGVPARPLREVRDVEYAEILASAARYVALAAKYREASDA